MKNKLIFIILFAFASSSFTQEVHQLSKNTFVKEYRIAGPFHDENIDDKNWVDLLENPFAFEKNIQNDDASYTIVTADQNGKVDFNKVLGDSACAVAYAMFEIEASSAGKGLLLIQAQDGAKVWVNDQYISAFFGGGWGGNTSLNCDFDFNKGINRIRIKVPNKDWGWNLSVKVLDDKHGIEYLENKQKESEFFEFLHIALKPETDKNFSNTFVPGRFPAMIFDKPGLASQYLGIDYTIEVRWFDRMMNEVGYPKTVGRYGYHAKVTGVNGKVIRKAGTLFCAPQDWMGWNQRPLLETDFIQLNDIPRQVWKDHSHAISEYLGFNHIKSLLNQRDGVVLWAFLDEVNRGNLPASPMNTPIIMDGDYHAQIKQKILGVQNKYPELKAPVREAANKAEMELRTLPDSFYNKMNAICEDWIKR